MYHLPGDRLFEFVLLSLVVNVLRESSRTTNSHVCVAVTEPIRLRMTFWSHQLEAALNESTFSPGQHPAVDGLTRSSRELGVARYSACFRTKHQIRVSSAVASNFPHYQNQLQSNASLNNQDGPEHFTQRIFQSAHSKKHNLKI